MPLFRLSFKRTRLLICSFGPWPGNHLACIWAFAEYQINDAHVLCKRVSKYLRVFNGLGIFFVTGWFFSIYEISKVCGSGLGYFFIRHCFRYGIWQFQPPATDCQQFQVKVVKKRVLFI